MVIVGVVLEGVELGVKWVKRHKTESILVKEAWWILWVESLALILVSSGLAVELWGSHRATLIARQTTNQLTVEARGAFDKARTAEIESGESKILAAQIGITNAQLSLQVAQLVGANLVLRSNVAVLEAKLQHRTITPENVKKFIEFSDYFIAYNHEQKGEVVVTADALDNESRVYARKIRLLLDEAGYNSKEFPEVIFEPPDYGIDLLANTNANIIMTFSAFSNAPPYALAVKRAFELIDIQVATVLWQNGVNPLSTNDPVTITVTERN
jgi:hypothetical protein